MSTVKFVHCADLHLDTPFRGLSDVAPDVGRALNEATFQSWTNIVDVAVREAVDFVVIAGDVYDSSDRSLRAQFRFRDGLKRLSDHGIPSFVAFGNHDPLSGWSNTLDWPELAHTFGSAAVDNCPVARGGTTLATIHGISYPKEAVTDNLSLRFERPDASVPSIAVLHANVGGDTAHLPYAPTTVEELSSKGFTYWALGHVHAHRILRADGPAIVYPGCSQSRQPNETGPKGCCLVTLADGRAPDIRFVATDAVRYHGGTVDVSGCASIDSVRQAIIEECRTAAGASEKRPLVVRLSLSGRTTLHRQLTHAADFPQLAEDLREELLALDQWVWLERLSPDTRGAYDISVQRQRQDFVGDLISVYDRLLAGGSDELERLQEEIESDLSSWGGRRYLEPLSPDVVGELAEQVMRQTLDRVVEED
ncbi:MAG: DNA repair exonuclease [Dehalococcoidia bacterium]|jgi:DNA repair exonuclease SbcCD nuclease subunit|nr:DNA repair exonuclease [Dehalococcoidia bacterium]